MRRTALGLALGLGMIAVSPLSAETYTVFSDVGVPNVPPDQVIVYPGAPVTPTVDGHATDIVPPEGQSSFKLQQPSATFGGWGVAYAAPKDLSRFASGELRLWVNSTLGNVAIEIKNGVGDVYSHTLNDLGWNASQSSQWVEYRIPLAGIDLSAVVNPFLVTVGVGPAVVYVDNVRYVSNAADPVFNVSILKRSDQSADTALTWASADQSAPWSLADQYINIDVDANQAAWGIQVYTDNTAPDASPVFTSPVAAGSSGSNPAGLIDTTDPTHRLALAWSVKAGTTVPTGVAAPQEASNPDSFQWFYIQDAATPAITSDQTDAFANGVPYQTAVTNAGIHFAQDPTSVGGANPPYKIFFEAPLGSALRPRTYQTTTLRVEMFYP